ncbi:hypothetical protein Droror1_Dr00018983 [Drosera rotundifolia]
MNHCAIQQNAVVSAEERRSATVLFGGASGVRKQCVVCPKPRRYAIATTAMDHHARPRPNYRSYQAAEIPDSKVGSELLDIILSKGGRGGSAGGGNGFERSSDNQVASSPPFFCGSPPSRVSNPLIQDARFRDLKLHTQVPFTPLPQPMPASSSTASSPTSSSARKGGCVRANFGTKPAVRVEGFDCLDRDSRNCSIPALA